MRDAIWRGFRLLLFFIFEYFLTLFLNASIVKHGVLTKHSELFRQFGRNALFVREKFFNVACRICVGEILGVLTPALVHGAIPPMVRTKA